MKKLRGLVILGSALFLFGCGGGGTTTTTSNSGSNPDSTNGGPVGYITIKLSNNGPRTLNFAHYSTPTTTPVLPLADSLRVVIKNNALVPVTTQGFDDNGDPITNTTHVLKEVTRIVKDYDLTYDAVNGYAIVGGATVPVPPGDHYTVEVLSSDKVKDASNNVVGHTMLKYGNSGEFQVTGGATATPAITVTAIAPAITPPMSGILSLNPYTVSLTKPAEIRNTWYLEQSLSPITSLYLYNPADTAGNGTGITLTALFLANNTPTQQLYLQGLFFIDDSLLDSTEINDANKTWTKWTLNYPNPTHAPSDGNLYAGLNSLSDVISTVNGL